MWGVYMIRHCLAKAVIAITGTVLMTGCGTVVSSTPNTSTQITTNATDISFTNRLNDMLVKPNPKFDVRSTDTTVYEKVPVYSEDGQKVVLDASKEPLFFEAYWCPHCQRTLVLMNKNRDKLKQMPIIVSIGFPAGTMLKNAVRISHEEMNAFKIHDVKVYYFLTENSSQFVHTYPTLVFSYQGKLGLLQGEHTLSAWQRALNQS
jgi:thiol-disulfide isomerase/thioredoxin